MQTRLKKAVIGGATVAVLGIGALTGPGAFAQTASTPAATTGTTAATATATAEQAAEAAQYQAFIKALGTNLGISDPTKVDAAIKTALKQMVDDQFTAGNISANEATAEKAAIDAGTGAGLLNLDQHGGHGAGMGKGGNKGGDNGQKTGANDQNTNANDAKDAGNGANGTSGTSGNGA